MQNGEESPDLKIVVVSLAITFSYVKEFFHVKYRYARKDNINESSDPSDFCLFVFGQTTIVRNGSSRSDDNSEEPKNPFILQLSEKTGLCFISFHNTIPQNNISVPESVT